MTTIETDALLDLQDKYRYSDKALHDLASKGIAEVRAGRYDGLRFKLFNAHEVSVVREFMRINAPEVPFGINSIVGPTE